MKRKPTNPIKKQKFHPPSQTYTVECSYDGMGRDDDIRAAARKVLGTRGWSDGSGFDFTTSRRDHVWRVEDRTKANKLARALTRLNLPKPCVVIQAPGKILVQP